MITGFNTDIEYQGVTYHVQTEDKGLATPLILSLVYDGGTILAGKRSPYEDLLDNFDENVLAERLQKQHKLMCAAIRAGRIEDLKRMTMKESALKQSKLIAHKEVVSPKEAVKSSPSENKISENKIAENGNSKSEILSLSLLDGAPIPPRRELLEELPPLDLSETLDTVQGEIINLDVEFEAALDIPIEIIETVEVEEILPAEAVEIISETVKQKPVNDKLNIELLSDDNFKSGERKTISMLVYRGETANVLSGAHVMVKVLGSTFRPLIFHATADSQGIVIMHLQLPEFQSGRAAVLIKAVSNGEEIEIRRLINHK